jgi:hypothetical protein
MKAEQFSFYSSFSELCVKLENFLQQEAAKSIAEIERVV